MADAVEQYTTTSAAYNKTAAIFTPVAYNNKPAAIITRHDCCDRNTAAATLAYLLGAAVVVVADGRL
jgi:hypothetical protein